VSDETDELAALERRLAAALRANDPVTALAAAASDPALSPELRRRVAAVHGDGLRLAARLVTRLRFERLVQGSLRASEWFETDPRSFVAAFRRYHAEVPASAVFPADEAALFAVWCSSNDM
jgi:hypothetical protein